MCRHVLDALPLANFVQCIYHLGVVVNVTEEYVQKSERLKGSLHFLGAAEPPKHTVFLDNAEDLATFDAAKHFDTPAELLDRTYNRPRTAQLADATMLPHANDDARKVNRCASRACLSDQLHQNAEALPLASVPYLGCFAAAGWSLQAYAHLPAAIAISVLCAGF